MQQLVEESTYRNELQMQLDSKESDIEQLREKLNDLQLRVESSSVTSLQPDETDCNIAGKHTRTIYQHLGYINLRYASESFNKPADSHAGLNG